jgi:hypothetical protein
MVDSDRDLDFDLGLTLGMSVCDFGQRRLDLRHGNARSLPGLVALVGAFGFADQVEHGAVDVIAVARSRGCIRHVLSFQIVVRCRL